MTKVPPRIVPNRDTKYMGLAWMMAGFSKDPNTQVGALIVDENNSPVGWGYNGPPRKINDESFSWERPLKYDRVVHAESNAIFHSLGKDLRGATIYVTAPPCVRCMLEIVSVGIVRVVYFSLRQSDPNSSLNNDQLTKTEEVAVAAGVSLEVFDGNICWLRDHIMLMKDRGCFLSPS